MFPTYSTGTVSIGAAATVVVGVGSLWEQTNAMPGDHLVCDGHEVTIMDVTDVTHLAINAWPFTAVSAGASYKIIQDSPLRFVGGQVAADMQKLVQALNTDGFYHFVDSTETVPDPSLGDDGQYALQANTGRIWLKTAGVWVFYGVSKPFTPQGAYNGATTYSYGDWITSAGSAYVFINATPSSGHAPPNVTYWQLLSASALTALTTWVTATAYVAGPPASFVSQGGSSYSCLISHTSGTFATDLAAGKWGLVAAAASIGLTGAPIVILTTGQSNFTQAPALAWSPATNATVWNFSGVNGNVGSAYVALSSTTINLPQKIASDRAKANPIRPVYLINISFSGQPISHWLSGATTPDVYANILANITAALAAAGVSQIDEFYFFQGESDAEPSLNTSYVANWNTMIARFKTNSWFPDTTPIHIFGISPTAVMAVAAYDVVNGYLASLIDDDPERRKFIYTPVVPAAMWNTAGGAPVHMTAAGYFAAGAMAAQIAMNGGRGSLGGGMHMHPVSGNYTIKGDMFVGYAVPPSGTVRGVTILGGNGTNGGTYIAGVNNVTNEWQIGNISALLGGSYDPKLGFYQPNGLYRFLNLTLSAGIVRSTADGTLSVGTTYSPLILGTGPFASVGAGGTKYANTLGVDVTEANIQFAAPFNMTLFSMQCNSAVAPSAGQTFTITLRKNGVDTALTAQISGTGKTAADNTHSVAFVTGDLISLKIVASASAAGSVLTAALLAAMT